MAILSPSIRILSNHGFRLQLLRLALPLGRLGEIDEKPRSLVKIGSNSQVKSIINETWGQEWWLNLCLNRRNF